MSTHRVLPPCRVYPALSRRRLLAAGLTAGATLTRNPSLSSPPASAAAQEIRLASEPDPYTARAIYMNPRISVTNEDFLYLVNMIDQTDLNALVVDVKEVGVYVPTAVPLFNEAGAVDPVLDAPGLLRTLATNDIYAIARLVCFRDDAIARSRPDLAVLDSETGEPWLDDGDGLWLNPLKEELWDAIGGYAVELANLGFDEIQFDYVRFPSDGDLTRMDFGRDVDVTVQTEAIAGFLGHCRNELAPYGVRTAADVFGYTYLLDDIGIGQNAAMVAAAVDVVCPMTYPSHYPEGSIDVPGHPNDFPYEVIKETLAIGAERVSPAQTRPWIQDFTLPGMSEYGTEQVRAQIVACEEAGTAGWMAWDPDNVYHADAFILSAS